MNMAIKQPLKAYVSIFRRDMRWNLLHFLQAQVATETLQNRSEMTHTDQIACLCSAFVTRAQAL